MIRRFILHILASAAALYFISLFLEGDFAVSGGLKGYFLAALIFGFLNSLVKPILKILSLPLILITAGLFTFILNMFVVWLGKYVLDILAFEGISIFVLNTATYLYVGLLLSVANILIHWLIRK